MYKKYPKGLKLTPDKEYLVLDNMDLKLAHKWYNGVCPFEDIKQQAFLILVDCATKFDPNNGNRFSTYAYRCIDIGLNNYVQLYNKLVNIPINKIYKIYKYLKLPEEEKEEFRIQSKLTFEDIKIYSTYEIVSMDAQVVDDYDDVSNFYCTEEEGYDRVEIKDSIQTIIKSLPKYVNDPIVRKIFVHVIYNEFDPETYKDIAEKYNVKLKRVYEAIEICQKALRENKNDVLK